MPVFGNSIDERCRQCLDFVIASERAEPSATDEVAWNFLDRTKVSELQRFIRQFPESRFRRAAEEAIGTATDDTKFSAALAPTLAQTEAAGDKAVVDNKTQLAALPASSEQGIELKLTVALQDELRRVGCNTGAVDGEWGVAHLLRKQDAVAHELDSMVGAVPPARLASRTAAGARKNSRRAAAALRRSFPLLLR